MDSRRAILKALAYYDIFDYPLTLEEIHTYQSGKVILKRNDIQKVLSSLSDVSQKEGYYFFSGRERIVAKRKNRENESQKKEEKSLSIVRMLRFIPGVQYVGISGSLAMHNSEKNDDIDLFIISRGGYVWTTRFFVSVFFRIIGKLRVKNDQNTKDKFCINMLIDSQHMQFRNKRKNVYTAHELVQLRTCINKNSSYEQLLHENNWLNSFLPAIGIPPTRGNIHDISKKGLRLVEWFFRVVQMRYMKSKITTETIQEGLLAFHPKDYTKQIIERLNKQYKKYGI